MPQTSPNPTRTSAGSVYLGTALIAFSMLALQIALTRLLSVTSWYHLAFFAVSTAMLGMTAGATTVYLRPLWFTEDRVITTIAGACLATAMAIPLSLILVCLLPLTFTRSLMTLISLLVTTISCSFPFYCSGIAVTAVLTKLRLPIGKLYASDLIGASFGCLFVLVGLEALDAPSLILLCGAISALAGFCFARVSGKKTMGQSALWIFALLCMLSIGNSWTIYGIRPYIVKGNVEQLGRRYIERWNSFSRVVVEKEAMGTPQLWGASPIAPIKVHRLYYLMSIDGSAETSLRRFSPEELAHLKYDITNLAYYLRQQGGACIIGVGGGRDIQSAILFGHERIVGIDVNSIFINLLQREFRDYAGVANRNGVKLYVDEARSFLSRNTDQYSIIQMSLVDTWAATGAGAFSFSENGLYTVEAWQVFINRLADDGIFTVSRWYNNANINETARIISLAVAALLKTGISEPSQHIVVATVDRLSTLLISKRPFTEQDIAKLRKVVGDLQYDLIISPDEEPRVADLYEIISARSNSALRRAVRNKKLNYEPPTDEKPYFFNMLRLRHISEVVHAGSGVLKGNLIASITLFGLILSLMVIALATIVVPLKIAAPFSDKELRPVKFWCGALYFSLIGAGFMFVEIALIQRLSIFLGHPVYALGILLFTIILSSGLGSYFSESLPLTRVPWLFVFPLLTALVIAVMPKVLAIIVSGMITSSMSSKIVVSIVTIFPLGIVMGFFFPTGMRLVKSTVGNQTPWYWALNGIFSVLASALAVFFSIYFGVSINFYIAATCYAFLLLCLPLMKRFELSLQANEDQPPTEEIDEIITYSTKESS